MLIRRTGIALAALAAFCAAGPAAADNIYKYQDENGIWHFTDRPPQEGVAFETVYMQREREARVRLRQGGTQHNPLYYVFNDYWGPVEIELDLAESVNVLSEPPLPARFVVPGQREELLVGLGAADPARGFQYRLQLSAVPGPPTPTPVSNLVVRPPFPSGQAYPVSQGFDGGRTHLDDESRYAIDIVMPEGTAVHAARDGVVIDLEEDFRDGGTDPDRFADKANHVRVLHDDGTMGLYAHLALASVIVRPGARVRAGQMLARSGSTGLSSGPHLHFAIQQNVGMRLISLPFEFRLLDGSTKIPAEGEFIGDLPEPR
jgi:murein DD-endopeptidase MepM/ murein hydrolase activator NlpD